jgi:hypothetical protein
LQFRYLKRLLFVHGHWSYVRNSNMILWVSVLKCDSLTWLTNSLHPETSFTRTSSVSECSFGSRSTVPGVPPSEGTLMNSRQARDG